MNFQTIKHLLLLISLILTLQYNTSASESESNKDFFSGGMAGHFGYASIENSHGEYNGPAFGLGGLVHFYVHKLIRIGTGGASTWMNYEANSINGSYMRLGYGGISTEFSMPLNKWRFSAGLFFGGGSYKNLHIISEDAAGHKIVDYIDRGTLIYSPLISIERKIGTSIKLFCLADFLMGPNLNLKGNFGGPKFLVGILFRK